MVDIPPLKHYDSATEQLIDQYLRRELSETEAKTFEARMDRDPELVEEVLLRRDIIIGIKAAEERAIRKLLDKTEDLVAARMNSNGGNVHRQRTRLLLIGLLLVMVAAAIVVAIVMISG